jgi:ABC-2 type transport system ATP-binding protein
MSSVIRLQNVTKRYGAQRALDAVSLEVEPGVVFALLGENGAGKTTAIRVLLGLTEPDINLNSASQAVAAAWATCRPALSDDRVRNRWFAAGAASGSRAGAW